jgi:hypothetical protein
MGTRHEFGTISKQGWQPSPLNVVSLGYGLHDEKFPALPRLLFILEANHFSPVTTLTG